MSKVSFIGLGVMGFPMAGYISKAGHDVTVYNRTKTKAEKWVKEHKGKSADTPMEAAKESDFIFIENLPKFNEINSNQQQRFITFIDIIYEKKIPLMIKSEVELNSLESSKSMKIPFKRTVSRLHELTSQSFN